MGQARYRSSCSALPNESLVEPAALEAGATLVVEVAVEATLVGAVAAKVAVGVLGGVVVEARCLLYTSPSPRDATLSRMPSSA